MTTIELQNNFRTGLRAGASTIGIIGLSLLIVTILIGDGWSLSLYENAGVPTFITSIYSVLESSAMHLLSLALTLGIVYRARDIIWIGPLNWKLFLALIVLGLLFTRFVGNPIHAFLFDFFQLQGGAIAEPNPQTLRWDIVRNAHPYAILAVSLISTAVIVPISEEVLFRGFLFSECRSIGKWRTVILSILIFSLAHYLVGGVAKVIAIFPAGILLTYLRVKFGDWRYTSASHMGLNAAVVLLAFLGP
jgi:membrane protease YdiL (CAAX protease family)